MRYRAPLRPSRIDLLKRRYGKVPPNPAADSDRYTACVRKPLPRMECQTLGHWPETTFWSLYSTVVGKGRVIRPLAEATKDALGFYSKLVVHGIAQLLFTAQVALRRLNGHVA